MNGTGLSTLQPPAYRNGMGGTREGQIEVVHYACPHYPVAAMLRMLDPPVQLPNGDDDDV
ncbi:hypothetical protein QQ44_13025 [Mycolicibacterium setense]|uniref:Uncharacterized protein n=1 Tax=Mycolicibacterium setense TaxID=431269 RepID=A0ABR4YWQ0_9MYCO|nr:hypothetical protein QQ44_13025 [Mycolicibacterium setense]